MGITHSRLLPLPPYKTPHKRKHSTLLLNLIRLPHLPHLLYHHRGRKKGYNTTTTLHALTHLRNVMTTTTIMLRTDRALSPERDPELRARFVHFLERAEDFYVRGCEECVRYNKATGWYDVDHQKVARGVEVILGAFLALMEEVGE